MKTALMVNENDRQKSSIPNKAVTEPAADFLSLLICPLTGGSLDYDKNKAELVSRSAKCAFPIRDGIPILVASEARQLSDKELAKKDAGKR